MSMRLILLLPIALVLASCSNSAKESPDQAEEDLVIKPRCIENWPVDPKATPSHSLAIDNAGQVLWTK